MGVFLLTVADSKEGFKQHKLSEKTELTALKKSIPLLNIDFDRVIVLMADIYLEKIYEECKEDKKSEFILDLPDHVSSHLQNLIKKTITFSELCLEAVEEITGLKLSTWEELFSDTNRDKNDWLPKFSLYHMDHLVNRVDLNVSSKFRGIKKEILSELQKSLETYIEENDWSELSIMEACIDANIYVFSEGDY